MLKAAVIGYGYWGPNIVRNLFDSKEFNPIFVIDKRDDRLEVLKRRHPSVIPSHDLSDEILGKVDAVFICTPAASHFELAKNAISLGKHVWIEKPITTNSVDAFELNRLASLNCVSVMADHTYTFSPSVHQIKTYIDSGRMGKLLYYNSLRFNLGIFQPDVSVIWDLAIHDLSIVALIHGFSDLEWISCVGFDPLAAGQKSIATITMGFKGEFSAQITVNWLSPLKIRKVVLGGQKGSIVFDDTEPSDKVAFYSQEFNQSEGIEKRISDLISYKLGETTIPRIDNSEPLSIGLIKFAGSIYEIKQGHYPNEGPLYDAANMIKVLEMCEKSILEGGVRVVYK